MYELIAYTGGKSIASWYRNSLKECLEIVTTTNSRGIGIDFWHVRKDNKVVAKFHGNKDDYQPLDL